MRKRPTCPCVLSAHPVLSDGETVAVKNEENVEMLAKTFKIHSSENNNDKGKRGREAMMMKSFIMMTTTMNY